MADTDRVEREDIEAAIRLIEWSEKRERRSKWKRRAASVGYIATLPVSWPWTVDRKRWW